MLQEPPGDDPTSDAPLRSRCEFVLLAPFMKLAHAVYRPVAPFFVSLSRQPTQGAKS